MESSHDNDGDDFINIFFGLDKILAGFGSGKKFDINKCTFYFRVCFFTSCFFKTAPVN